MMHSGLLVFLWLLAVAGLQFLDPGALSMVLAASVIAVARFASMRGKRLVKRVRFILIAIVILFAGFTPGEAIFVDWPAISPSREGVVLAYEHAARVLVVVLFVALLMEYLPAPRLIGALHALLRPLRPLGVPADRVAVRTLLVLRFVEAEKPPRWDHWISDDSNDLHEAIAVERQAFGTLDRVVIALLALSTCVLLWWGLQ